MRDALADFLGILQEKVRRGCLTVDDMRAILTALEAGGGVSATIEDLASFYKTTPVNVRSVIKRRVFAKPKRRVYYDFGTFRQAVPEKWRKRRYQSDDYE